MDTDLAPIDASVDPDVRDAALAFFPEAKRIAPVPDHPDLARVETSDGSTRVRRWLAASSVADVAFSHQVTIRARDADLSVVPTVIALPGTDETILRQNGRNYDAQQWLSGAPPARSEVFWPDPETRIDLPVTLPDVVFRDVVAATAALHLATADLAGLRDVPSAPLSMLPGAVQQAQARHLSVLRSRAPREPSIQRWLASGERLLASAGPIVLRAAEDPALPETVVHLALWPSHILIENGSLSGILGWERVAVGPPLLDLAQVILRLHGWSDDIVESAIGMYSDVRPFSPTERRLLPAVAALDAVAATGRLLEQTFSGGRTDRPPSSLRAAIDVMLRSMTNLDRTLSTPDKPRRRVWQHRPARPVTAKGERPRARPRPNDGR